MTTATARSTGLDIDLAAEKWLLWLELADRSPQTLRGYRASVRLFADFLRANGMPTDVEHITRDYIEAFLLSLKDRSPATRLVRYINLKGFFTFLVDEDDIRSNPMERLKPPKQPVVRTPLLTDEQISAIRKHLNAAVRRRPQGFTERRDLALFNLFLDSGLRLAEMAALGVEDVDIPNRVLRVRHGKGDKERLTRFSKDTAMDLMRYRTVRQQHRHAGLRAWWIGHRGALSYAGIDHAMRAAAEAVGVSGFHVHRLRHTFAHKLKARGVSPESIMALGGWSSPAVMQRYGASAATERALEDYDKAIGR